VEGLYYGSRKRVNRPNGYIIDPLASNHSVGTVEQGLDYNG
jgi:hypothetical protein